MLLPDCDEILVTADDQIMSHFHLLHSTLSRHPDTSQLQEAWYAAAQLSLAPAYTVKYGNIIAAC